MTIKIFFSVFFILSLCMVNAQDEGTVSLQERLKSNIFLKVEASSTDVFVGEPITVTYKLYSAMASESNIVKRPGFSDFDVKDLGANGTPSRDNVDGVVFDVHEILKLQLTPLRAGTFSLGSLTMRNRVQLEDANGNKDPILDGVAENYTLNNGYYTLTIASVPLKMLVTALPGQSQPSGFKGIIGSFKMDVEASKPFYAPGEQGELAITFTGVGDFSQLTLPEVKWPDGIEVFPAKTDEDETAQPGGTGYKSFTIPFKADAPGKYIIPPVTFPFFDVATNQYKTITNIPVTFNVVQEGIADMPAATASKESSDYDALLMGVCILLAFLLSVWLIVRMRKKKKAPAAQQLPVKQMQPVKTKEQRTHKPGIDDLLKPAKLAIEQSGNSFSIYLKGAISKYVEQRLSLPVDTFNHNTLKQALADNHVAAGTQVELLNLLADIDMNIYSGGSLETDRAMLLNRTHDVLKKFES